MDMDNTIRQLAHQLAEEARAIGEYTNSIGMTDDTTLKTVLIEIRKDELAHAQKLVIALTEAMGGEEPVVAAEMDEDAEEGGDDDEQAEE